MSNKIPSKIIVSSIRAAKTIMLGTMLYSACVLVMPTPAFAQQAASQNVPIESVPKDIMKSIEIPAQPDAIDLGTQASDATSKLKTLTGPEYNTNVRIWSATAICKISGLPPNEALDLLGQLLLDDMDNEDVQNDAPEAIAQLGPFARPLLDSLERAKKHKSAQIRWGLVDAFFAIDADSAVSRCLPLMEDENELVAETVIEAFSKRSISDSRVIAAYIRALSNHDGSFDQPASSAVEALTELGDAAKASIPALEELLKNLDLSDTLRKDVVSALSRIR